jgi:carbon monoxide dehydrogenase subunit G
MIVFETSIRIDRPVGEVFSYVSDPVNLPNWNSAVEEVRRTAPRFVMVRRLPIGRAVNELEVVESRPPRSFEIRTLSGPTPFRYRYRFSGEGEQTLIRLEAEVDLRGAATMLPRLVRGMVKNGVDANFAALKALLEARPPAAAA